jgi:hydroxylaminobenzene mutase
MTESGSYRTRHGRVLLRLGAVLFLLGVLTGLGIPHFAAPRQALSARLLAVTQATLLMVLGLVWPRLKLTPGQSRLSSGLGSYGFPAAWLATLWAAFWRAGATMIAFALSVLWGLRGAGDADA